MSAPIDRAVFPWNQAPSNVDNYDAATWHAMRKQTDGALPIQSLKRWSLEQRARRSRDALAGAR